MDRTKCLLEQYQLVLEQLLNKNKSSNVAECRTVSGMFEDVKDSQHDKLISCQRQNLEVKMEVEQVRKQLLAAITLNEELKVSKEVLF